jgi:hypothetical protein
VPEHIPGWDREPNVHAMLEDIRRHTQMPAHRVAYHAIFALLAFGLTLLFASFLGEVRQHHYGVVSYIPPAIGLALSLFNAAQQMRHLWHGR